MIISSSPSHQKTGCIAPHRLLANFLKNIRKPRSGSCNIEGLGTPVMIFSLYFRDTCAQSVHQAAQLYLTLPFTQNFPRYQNRKSRKQISINFGYLNLSDNFETRVTKPEKAYHPPYKTPSFYSFLINNSLLIAHCQNKILDVQSLGNLHRSTR